MNLKKRIEKSKQVQKKVRKLLNLIEGTTTHKELTTCLYMSITQEHHKAIIFLVENKKTTSAMALLRPLFEATYRGTWIAIVANEDEVEKLIKTDTGKFKLIEQYAKEIDKNIQEPIFHEIFNRNKGMLNGFVHGGLEQLGHHLVDGKIKPNFSDEEIIELLNMATASIEMMTLSVGYALKNEKIIKEATKMILS